MRVSVGSPVVPRNCHQCPRPDWGHVTANTSVVRAVCGPEIIFPELSLKNKDELKWEKASACPPSSSTSFLCALYSHRAGRDKDKLVAAADDNPPRDLPSWIFLSSPATCRHILVSISISSLWALHSLLSAQNTAGWLQQLMGRWERGRQGHPKTSLSSHLWNIYSHIGLSFPQPNGPNWKPEGKCLVAHS